MISGSMKTEYRSTGRSTLLCLLVVLAFGIIAPSSSQTEMKRNRGESFYRLLSSNTEGTGNLWLSFTAVGHVWDDKPVSAGPSADRHTGFWMSSFRAFPEVRAQYGLSEWAMATIESRPITWAAKMPGTISGDVKLTWPNNKKLRFLGYGLDLKYIQSFTHSTPTLGGYLGFMPEGYVTLGSIFETKFLFDVDLLPKITSLPLRGMLNLGTRLPLSEYQENFQILADIGAIFTGYDYDFFAAYSLEAFNNFTGPRTFTQHDGSNKKWVIWFKENPMYLVLGGNVRYKGGIILSIVSPLLLSANEGSGMNDADRASLSHYVDFPYENTHLIKDAFDPWFVKWKILGSLTFPIRYKITSAEMMRNFLLLKNSKKQSRLDIDNRLRNFEQATTPEPVDEKKDTERRLEEIQKRKEEMKNSQ
ncbi:MAG: hypothetical protein MUF22_03445 [Chitinispirillaceae bacterium]|jgi:hypothetical protein|nr:hypothetical protein [Chitinispirillaceae bacterium]